MRSGNLKKWTSWAVGLLAFALSLPATAAAQCIMCYMSADSTGERGSHVLRTGILVLAIPTLMTFAGLFLLAYRRRNPQGSTETLIPPELNGNEALLIPPPDGQPTRIPSVL